MIIYTTYDKAQVVFFLYSSLNNQNHFYTVRLITAIFSCSRIFYLHVETGTIITDNAYQLQIIVKNSLRCSNNAS